VRGDALLAGRLLQRLGPDPAISAAAGYTASEFKGLISGCALLVTERMHPAIAGLSTGVPTVAVRYSIKADGIMRQVMGPELSEELLVPVDSFLDPANAIRVSQGAWRRRSEVADVLSARIPEVRRLAARNFDLIAEVMRAS
jgi:polysaccharide pyruvyl transferase WcaK-like protein